MPVGKWPDMAACMAANQDKDDPAAYCAAMERQMKGMTGTIAKTDDAQGLVYGWASVVVKDGASVVDLQGDVIEPAELEKAAVQFMLNHRAAGEMHQGKPTGVIVESVVMSPEKASVMGFGADIAKSAPTGLWIGVKMDPHGETFRKVKAGEYKMFSIQGKAKRTEV